MVPIKSSSGRPQENVAKISFPPPSFASFDNQEKKSRKPSNLVTNMNELKKNSDNFYALK